MYKTMLQILCISCLGVFVGLGAYCLYKAVNERNDNACIMAALCGAALLLNALLAGELL
jgi:putative effector of murein hydrolase